jgi:hypothetical protein
VLQKPVGKVKKKKRLNAQPVGSEQRSDFEGLLKLTQRLQSLCLGAVVC